jgi:SAM-dependent methyltransferase
MVALKRFAFLGLLVTLCSAARGEAPVSLRADLRYVPRDATLVIGFEPWPDGGDGSALRDAVLAAVGFEPEVQKAAQVLTGAKRVLLCAVPDGARASWLGVVRTDRRISKRAERAAGIAIAPARPGGFLFGDPAQVARAARPLAAGSDLMTTGGLDEPFLEAAAGATAWGVVTRTGISCRHCGLPPGDIGVAAETGSFTRALASMPWWTFAVRGGATPSLHMRTRARSAEDAEILADAQRAALAELRLRARGGEQERLIALRQARVQQAGATIDVDLPRAGLLLGWLCRKENCDAPLLSLLGWQLEPEMREKYGRASEILRRLRVAPGEHVADVGAGLGFFATQLARVVGREGRVVAVEINEDLVTELRARAAEAPYPQVEAVLGTAEDPKLAAQSLDAVLIVNSYHEMPQHQLMLGAIRRALKPNGRLMLVEPFAAGKRANPRDVQEREHLLAPELAEQDLREAGFRIVECDETFLQLPGSDHGDWLILARPPQP